MGGAEEIARGRRETPTGDYERYRRRGCPRLENKMEKERLLCVCEVSGVRKNKSNV